MSVISDYLIKIERQYPSTEAVSEQIEELRDTLHIKTEEYQSQGMSYNEAAKAAITSLGDVSPLLDEVSGNVRQVFVNRLNKSNTLFCSLIIIAEFMMGWIFYSLVSLQPLYPAPFFATLLLLLIGICIWPITTVLRYRKDPDKISLVEMPYQKQMRIAKLGWAGLSLFLFIVNWLTGAPTWFQWPVMGIATWPINVYLYHRQLIGGRYDAA